MAAAAPFYNAFFRRNWQMLGVVFGSAFAFEMAYDTTMNRVWDSLNRGIKSDNGRTSDPDTSKRNRWLRFTRAINEKWNSRQPWRTIECLQNCIPVPYRSEQYSQHSSQKLCASPSQPGMMVCPFGNELVDSP
ncbi:hypothetical protein M426DRAFT_206341 [Hypoxylon sp. CI-4A]|nr:hypothetical protein M426DRAFT_206341 [Hypoxylon sp. CI-4A]